MPDTETLIAELQHQCNCTPCLCGLDVARAFAALGPAPERTDWNPYPEPQRATPTEIAWASANVRVLEPTLEDLEVFRPVRANTLVARVATERKSVATLRQMPPRFNTGDFGRAMGCTIHAANGRLRGLLKKGLVRRAETKGGGVPTVWERVEA